MSQTSSAPPTQVVVKAGRSSFLGRLGWIAFFICLAVLLSNWRAREEYYDTTSGTLEKYVSGKKMADNKIAVIRVSGVILSGSGFVKKQIDRIRKDKSVKAVVLRINSPGGTISGAHYLYHHLSELRKERNLPIVVSMGSIAASGGYYLAMAAGKGEDLIFAEPTTTTGSIGVIIPYYNASDLMAKIGVQDQSIKSHPLKDMLSMTRPLTDEERAIAQEYVDAAFRRFKRVILESRPQLKGEDADSVVDPKTGKDLATGQIFTAEQALEYQLIDRIGFLEDAVARAREMAGLSESNSRVVEYHARPTLLSSLTGVEAQTPLDTTLHNPHPAARFWEATAPQAYYLATTVPPLMHSFSLLR